MIHNEWIARDAVSALGRFGHRIRIPPRAVGRLGAWVFDLRYLLIVLSLDGGLGVTEHHLAR